MRWCWADRLSTAGLLAILGMLSPRWYFGFLALLMLDIFSHWFQMYATMASGASTHKVVHPLQPIQASGSWVCMSPYVWTNQLAGHALTKAVAEILARSGTQWWSLPLEQESWLYLGRALLCFELSAVITCQKAQIGDIK
jgi:phosphatidylglycerophosphate synthase